jgi:hypothetical protein
MKNLIEFNSFNIHRLRRFKFVKFSSFLALQMVFLIPVVLQLVSNICQLHLIKKSVVIIKQECFCQTVSYHTLEFDVLDIDIARLIFLMELVVMNINMLELDVELCNLFFYQAKCL